MDSNPPQTVITTLRLPPPSPYARPRRPREFALRERKPFAIVPCCVFANLNPWRRSVRTYTALLEYLMARARAQGADVQRCDLPFDGKNTLLYALRYV